MEKKLGVVKMRGVHTVFEAEGGYEVFSAKDEHDRNGEIKFIPFSIPLVYLT